MKNELQTLRLFSPLFPHIYRRNEWGDYENEPEDLTAFEILEYEDIILNRIEKEKLPDEGERGLAVYLDDTLSEKIDSIHPSMEEWNDALWGVISSEQSHFSAPYAGQKAKTADNLQSGVPSLGSASERTGAPTRIFFL